MNAWMWIRGPCEKGLRTWEDPCKILDLLSDWEGEPRGGPPGDPLLGNGAMEVI